MRIPRSRGAVSGLLLIVLGAWSALIPFIGPSFDLATTPVNPIRTVTLKPCRTGGLRALLDLYAHCEAEGIRIYGGGMGENGVGRGQIQLLASIFHPDTPNDVAPSAFNLEDPPEGLPSSPLPPQPEAIGFRRAEG